jgi:hypothetical protein
VIIEMSVFHEIATRLHSAGSDMFADQIVYLFA